MKTVLTELIEDLQDMCPDYYNNNYNWLHNSLEKEKQQIIDAFNQGFREGETETMIVDTQKDVAEYDDAINYYNETYKK